MKKILVVEDDVSISDMLCELLKQNGYSPIAAYSGSEAILAFKSVFYDLVLLDLMLPGKNGSEVLSVIRENSNVPVIALTAVTDKQSTVTLLRSGADDYLSKPFDNEELLARIEVQLRKQLMEEKNGVLRYKDILLSPDSYTVSVADVTIELSKREFEILQLLMTHPKKVFSKNNLYETVWEEPFVGDDNTINVHISNLRSKLSKNNPEEEYIQTVWGIGFKMHD